MRSKQVDELYTTLMVNNENKKKHEKEEAKKKGLLVGRMPVLCLVPRR